jgi:hypothetical protein
MKPPAAARKLAIAITLVLIAYAASYALLQHRRVAKGPWEVTFTREAGAPTLVVNQSRLGIANVRLVFTGAQVSTNVAQTLRFIEARPVPFDVPFGKCVFLDSLFLPGTVAFEMFGHEIQLLPRVLTIDRVEHPWQSSATITLTATNQAPVTP